MELLTRAELAVLDKHGQRRAGRGQREAGQQLWYPAPPELAQIDHQRYQYAIALGLVLPIRLRWAWATGRWHKSPVYDTME